MTVTTPEERARLVAATLRSLAGALTGMQEIAGSAVQLLGELADLVDPDEDLDERLTGNPDPSTHDGIGYWPMGDATTWTPGDDE